MEKSAICSEQSSFKQNLGGEHEKGYPQPIPDVICQGYTFLQNLIIYILYVIKHDLNFGYSAGTLQNS